MWFEIIAGAIMLGTYIYHRLEDKEGPALRVAELPKINEGSPVPLVYGRCRIYSPFLAWAGNWHRVDYGDIGGPEGVINYSLTQLFVLGIPYYQALPGDVTLHRAYAGDIQLDLGPFDFAFWNGAGDPPCGYTIGPTAGIQHYTTDNAKYVYGQQPASSSDGVIGNLEFFEGRLDQEISGGVIGGSPFTYTEANMTGEMLGHFPDVEASNSVSADDIPGYRNQIMCCLWLWFLGRAGSLTSYGFEVSSYHSFNSINPFPIGDETDPALVIYDLLTSPWGKVGLPTSQVDIPSFQAASAVLVAENHGYSRVIGADEDAITVIGEIVRQIDGVFFFEPTTGKITLRLVRMDYDILELTNINPDNAVPASSAWYQVQGQSETYNQVTVTYTNRFGGYAEGRIVGQNGANIVGQLGRIRSLDLAFPGCCTEDLARRITSRELAAVSRPMTKISVVVNRSFHGARPGDVFTFTWPQLGIDQMVVRVGRVNFGSLDRNQITLVLIRDIFDVTIGAF